MSLRFFIIFWGVIIFKSYQTRLVLLRHNLRFRPKWSRPAIPVNFRNKNSHLNYLFCQIEKEIVL
jgi:hypothetical protein